MAIKSILLVTIGVILVGSFLTPLCFPQEENNTLDVVIIDGQSNAQYWGWGANNLCSPSIVNASGLEAPTHNLYYYGDSTPTYYGPVYTNPTYDTTLTSYDLHKMYDGEWKIGSYGPTLAKLLSERSGHDVLVIDVGVGAAPIQWLTTTGPGGMWAEKIITDALSKVPTRYHIDMLGMVWAQGESDASTAVDTYIERFNTLYNSLNDKFGLDKVYVIKTRDAVGGNSITAQEQLAAENENIVIATSITDTFTTENGLLNTDNLHYTQQGRTVIAEILGSEITFNEHPANENLELLKALPILVIVALLVAAVGAIAHRRTD